MKVFDHDGSKELDEKHHDFCGEAVFTLANLMCARGQRLELPLQSSRGRAHGSLLVRAEAVANTRDLFITEFVGTKLSNKDGWFGKSDPYLKLYR